MPIIWEVVDRFGRPVVLTDEGWAHITERHQEMSAFQDAIREAVAFADEVVHDAAYAHREIHYRRRQLGPRWLRVIVQYRLREPQGWFGMIITAHFINVRPRKEVQSWPPQDET